MDQYYHEYFTDSDDNRSDENGIDDDDDEKYSVATPTLQQKVVPKIKSNNPKRQRKVKFETYASNKNERANHTHPQQSAVSRPTEIKIAYKHLRDLKKMTKNGKNSIENRKWLEGQILHIEVRLQRLYNDEKKMVYGSTSKMTALDRRTQNINVFWIPKILVGIEQRKIT